MGVVDGLLIFFLCLSLFVFVVTLLTLTTSMGWMKVTVMTAAPPAIPICERRPGPAPAVARSWLFFCWAFMLIVVVAVLVVFEGWSLVLSLLVFVTIRCAALAAFVRKKGTVMAAGEG